MTARKAPQDITRNVAESGPTEWAVWWTGPLTDHEKRLAWAACEDGAARHFLQCCELYRGLEYADREARIDLLLDWLADGGVWVPAPVLVPDEGDRRRGTRERKPVSLAKPA